MPKFWSGDTPVAGNFGIRDKSLLAPGSEVGEAESQIVDLGVRPRHPQMIDSHHEVEKTIQAPARAISKSVRIPVNGVSLSGDLEVPADALGIVIFAHGSGSSRHSPRNQLVAHQLQQAGMGTLLFDLLTTDEEIMDQDSCELRFNIRLLADRLSAVARWVAALPETKGLKLGFFGASTGGGAALVSAAELGSRISAVVSRGGRPDLAGPFLPRVKAPTLLIVGGCDTIVIEMNETALAQLRCEKQMRIVPAASHLFEEPGKLKEVAELSARWFAQHLRP